MIDNTIFLPYDQEALNGYTQKQFAKIYISTNLFKDTNYNTFYNISKIVVDISYIIILLDSEKKRD